MIIGRFYSLILLVQACGHLLGRPDEILSLLQKNARQTRIPFGVTPCGIDNPNSLPNNHFGHGELDIKAAIAACKQQS